MRPKDYPRTKFADENDIIKQVRHIESEINEFVEAWALAHHYKYTMVKPERSEHFLNEMVMEAQDIIQSAFTLVDIIARLHPELDAWSFVEKMIEKNQERDYYSEVERA